MSERASKFLQSWVLEHVNATVYEDRETAQELARACLSEAKTEGITEAELTEAAGDNLQAYMLGELNSAVSSEVEDRVARDQS